MSPAHEPRDPRCPLSPGVFSPESDCAGELGEPVETVSSPEPPEERPPPGRQGRLSASSCLGESSKDNAA